MLFLDRGQTGNDDGFVHRHHVLVGIDPRDFGVDRGELGRVTRGERRIGSEGRADFENRTETGWLRHLLEELRALREVRLRFEVVHLE